MLQTPVRTLLPEVMGAAEEKPGGARVAPAVGETEPASLRRLRSCAALSGAERSRGAEGRAVAKEREEGGLIAPGSPGAALFCF